MPIPSAELRPETIDRIMEDAVSLRRKMALIETLAKVATAENRMDTLEEIYSIARTASDFGR